MKLSRLIPISAVMAVLFFLSSCNGNEEKRTDTMTSDTMATATTTPVPEPATASSIVTTEQNMIVVRHKVANFDKWRASYDAHDSMRVANGIHTYVIGRGVSDPNMVLVSLKLDDLAKAKDFMKSPSLKQAMQKGGVIGVPMASIVTITYQDTANIGNTPIRVVSTLNVKDWATWLKSFEEGAQDRKDNGIMLRAYGHDADNNNHVRVVTALSDSAKAVTYWKSDAMKKRLADGGVMGQPERFMYRIVQRY